MKTELKIKTKQMKIEESNQMIAEFMGAKKSPHFEDDYQMYGIIECIKDGENEWHFFHPQDMEFQTSWDWLMPVVTKCLDIYHIEQMNDDLNFKFYDSIGDIKKTYKAVVEFIKFYNENK